MPALLVSRRWPRSFCHSWQRPLFGHVQLLYERDIAHSYPFVPVRIRFRVVVRAEAAYFFFLIGCNKLDPLGPRALEASASVDPLQFASAEVQDVELLFRGKDLSYQGGQAQPC